MAAAAILGGIEAAPLLIHVVTGIVHAVEGLFGKGNGAQKKAAAVDASQGILSAWGTVAGIFNKTAPDPNLIATDLGNLIDAIVKFNNDIGLFKHANHLGG